MIIKTLVPIVDPVTKLVAEWEASIEIDQNGQPLTFLHRFTGPAKKLGQFTEADMESVQAAAKIFPVSKPVFLEHDIPAPKYEVVDPVTGAVKLST